MPAIDIGGIMVRFWKENLYFGIEPTSYDKNDNIGLYKPIT